MLISMFISIEDMVQRVIAMLSIYSMYSYALVSRTNILRYTS